MKHWAWRACVALGAGLAALSSSQAENAAPAAKPASSRVVVAIKSDRIVLMDVALSGNRLVAVGERGFTLMSDDRGKTWHAHPTPVDRTLTGVAFKDGKTGVAVGHGGTLIRTDDGGESWTHVPLEEAGPDSLLGVVHLADDHFVAYGAFGLYFDSTDGGKTWRRGTVLNEDFDRHISQVVPVGSSLFLVAESGTLARSDDAGATWTAITSPYQGSYFGALATRSGALLAYGMRGNIWRSADLGVTWQKIGLDTTVSLMSGRQLADGRILLVGNSGLIAESSDDGQTFALHWSPERYGFASLAEVAGQVVLVGETGVTQFDAAWLKDSEQAAAR